MKKYLAWIVLVVMLFALCGCSNQGAKEFEPSSHEEICYSSVSDVEIVLTEDRLLVYSADVTLVATDVKNTLSKVTAKMSELGGHTKKLTTGTSYTTFILCVPTTKLQTFLNYINDKDAIGGEITRQTVTADDITELYNTAVASQEAALAKKNAMQALLDKAVESPTATYDDILKLTNALLDAAKEYDKYAKSVSDYKSQAEFSTVYLDIYEADTYVEPSYWEELIETLFGSVESVGDVFGAILIVITALLPYVVIVGILFGIYALIKYLVCKSKGQEFSLFKKARERRLLRKKEKELREKQLRKSLGMDE